MGPCPFWTTPVNPRWRAGSDDGSVARSCACPSRPGSQDFPVGLGVLLPCTPGEPHAAGCQATS